MPQQATFPISPMASCVYFWDRDCFCSSVTICLSPSTEHACPAPLTCCLGCPRIGWWRSPAALVALVTGTVTPSPPLLSCPARHSSVMDRRKKKHTEGHSQEDSGPRVSEEVFWCTQPHWSRLTVCKNPKLNRLPGDVNHRVFHSGYLASSSHLLCAQHIQILPSEATGGQARAYTCRVLWVLPIWSKQGCRGGFSQ